MILELAFVREAVVRGEAHPLMGQIVTARIVRRPWRSRKPFVPFARTVPQNSSDTSAIKIEVATSSAVGDRQKPAHELPAARREQRHRLKPRRAALAGARSIPRC